MSKLIDLTGEDFGYWHVIERAKNRPGGKAYWKCICTACGKEKEVSGSHLRGGRSTNCGCVANKRTSERCTINETGKQYGFLKVIRKAEEEEKPRHDRYGAYWVCFCKNCGRDNVIVFGDYLRKGDTISCGCINSKNESKIAKILDNAKIKYQQQYTFDDLTSTGRSCDKLMFDFAVFNDNRLLYLIEYDGAQHFLKEHEFKKGQFETTRKNDLQKNQYCFRHNIPLIRIPYNKQYDLNDLKIETTKFLLTEENEEEYYK